MPLIGAIEAGGTSFVAAVADSAEPTQILHRLEVPVQESTPKEVTLECLRFLRKHDVASLGVASFGPIDLRVRADRSKTTPHLGRITSTPKAAFRDFPLLDYCRLLRVPIQVDTDVNAPALSEAAARGVSNLCYVTVGTGVGVGVVVNGRTVQGKWHPEAGHMLGVTGVRAGTCRFHADCVEGAACAAACAARANVKPSELQTLSDGAATWDTCAQALALLCANLVLTVSPEIIVLGGGVMQRACLLEKVRQETARRLGDYLEETASIEAPVHADAAGVVGALELARKALLHGDVLETQLLLRDMTTRAALFDPLAPESAGQGIRCTQFNVLADGLGTDEFDSLLLTNTVDKYGSYRSHRGPLQWQHVVHLMPHILCLQEVNRYEDFWYSRLRAAGFASHFAEKRESPCLRFGMPADGSVLAFRADVFECVDTATRYFGQGTHSQVCLSACLRVRATGQRLLLYCLHLKAKKTELGERVRVQQAKETLEWIAADSARFDTDTVLVLGDLNATPDAPSVACFLNEGFRSLGRDGFTTCKSRRGRLHQYTGDYVLARGASVRPLATCTLPDGLADDLAVTHGLPNRTWPSDHLSITVDLALH